MRSILTVDAPTQKVLGIRRTGRYEEIGPMIKELSSFIEREKITVIGPPAYICHEESLKAVHAAAEAGNADIEVAFPFEGEGKGRGDISAYELPGGKMARIIHMGPYRELPETYQELFKWLGDNHLTITGPVREVYINNPETTEEDLLVTWIYAPI